MHMQAIKNFLEQQRKEPSITKNQSISQQFHRYKVSVRLFIKHVQQEFSQIIDSHQSEKKELQGQIQELKKQVASQRLVNPIKTIFVDEKSVQNTTNMTVRDKKQADYRKNRNLNILGALSHNTNMLDSSKISQIPLKQKDVRNFSPQFQKKHDNNEWFDEQFKMENKSKSIIQNLSLTCDDLEQKFIQKDNKRQPKIKKINQKQNKCVQKQERCSFSNKKVFNATEMLRDLRNTMEGKPQTERKCFRSLKKVKFSDYQNNSNLQKQEKGRQIKSESDEQEKRIEQLTVKEDLNPTQVNELRKSKKFYTKPSPMYKVNRNYDFIDVLFR